MASLWSDTSLPRLNLCDRIQVYHDSIHVNHLDKVDKGPTVSSRLNHAYAKYQINVNTNSKISVFMKKDQCSCKGNVALFSK